MMQKYLLCFVLTYAENVVLLHKVLRRPTTTARSATTLTINKE